MWEDLMQTDLRQDELAEILAPFAGKKGTVIPILQKVQERFGYISRESLAVISRFLGISESELFGVITFYAQFRLKPTGKHMVMVCRGTACHVRGGSRIKTEVEKTLGIRAGDTTPDMEYSLETIACIGACALAPTMVIDKNTYGEMTTKKVGEILGDGRKQG
ncbi:MAG: NADH-quinone oxidoreductase subunit NuoE [Chloroflexi bacterium]|nr:NADH-quinone oxidoreductase subunit NuoE [Chloroflexota bacterium]